MPADEKMTDNPAPCRPDEHETRERRFRRWVRRYQPLLWRTSRGFAARDGEADDLMQEMLLALWKATDRFRKESSETTFVYRVVHNVALHWQRTRQRRRWEPLERPDAVIDPHPDVIDPVPTLHVEHSNPRSNSASVTDVDPTVACSAKVESTSDERLFAILRQKIAELPPLDRSLMLMSLDDLTYAEIAEVLGMTRSHVGVRLHRLRKRLLQQIERELDGV